MIELKAKLRDVTNYRTNEKCYLIEDVNNDFFVIYGTRYREVINGELYDIILSFINGPVGWDFVDKRLRINRDNDYREGKNHDWADFNELMKDKVLDIEKLFVDGVKTEVDNSKY